MMWVLDPVDRDAIPPAYRNEITMLFKKPARLDGRVMRPNTSANEYSSVRCISRCRLERLLVDSYEGRIDDNQIETLTRTQKRIGSNRFEQ